MKKTNTTTMPTAIENTTKAPKNTGKRKPSVTPNQQPAVDENSTPNQPAAQPKGTEDTAPDVADAVSALSLDDTVAELNKKESERIATGSVLFVHAKNLVDAENKARRTAFGAKLFAIMDEKGTGEMFREFIASPKYTAITIKQDPKTGEYKSGERKVELSFSKLDRLYQLAKSTENDAQGHPIANKSVTLASDKKWELYFNMLVDNIGRFNAGEIEASAPSSTLEAKARKEYGFDKVSVSALTVQMNKVVAAILPEDMPVSLLNLHTKYMLMASTVYKDRKIVGSKEAVFMSALFAAIDNKINGTKLVFESKAKVHKTNNQ